MRAKAAFHSKYADSSSPFARNARCKTSRQCAGARNAGNRRASIGGSKTGETELSFASSSDAPCGARTQPLIPNPITKLRLTINPLALPVHLGSPELRIERFSLASPFMSCSWAAWLQRGDYLAAMPAHRCHRPRVPRISRRLSSGRGSSWSRHGLLRARVRNLFVVFGELFVGQSPVLPKF